MSDFLIFKAAFNNSATPAIGTYTAEGATALFNMNASLSPDYYLYNTADGTAVQWFVPTKETTDFEFVADILTRSWTNRVTYFIIADSTGTTRLRMWSVSDNWHFENSDSTNTAGDPEYIGTINPLTSGGFGVFHRFRVRVHKLTASSSSVEVYVDGTLKLTAGAALITCAKIGFVGGVNTYGPGTSVGVMHAYVYDLSGRPVIDRGTLLEAFNRFINWEKNSLTDLKNDLVPRSGGSVITGSSLGKTDDTGSLQICGGSTGAGGASVSLSGKDRGLLDGVAQITAHDSTNTTELDIYPDGTMEAIYPDSTVKNIAMQEDVVPRSGGSVMSGGSLGRTVNGDEFRLDGGTGWNNGASITLTGKDNSEAGVIRIHVSDGSLSSDMTFSPSGTVAWNGNYLRPTTNGYCTLGAAQYRYKELYAANGTINTSDSRLKNSIKDIDSKLLDAWENIEPKQYKFNDATEKKGEKARYHTGYLAQDIQLECEKHGINASDYGLFCYDEWGEQEEISEEIETEKDGKKVKEKHVIQPKREKGNIYALRYEEALVVECKYLRRCIERLTARIEQLEKEREAGK